MGRYCLTCAALFLLLLTARAQISQGGKPLPFGMDTRAATSFHFEEMPSFDLAEELRINALDTDELRGSYRFAYKFMTNFNRSNSGYSYTLADGTKVWRLGIRSCDALSINVLFTEFEIPEGARLFLYNPDQTHILGAFTSRNHSDLHILPISPVEGEELIIEYQEPAQAAFAGRLTIGEVNHGYRSLRDKEPDSDRANFYCMEPVACFPNDPLITDELGRSVVLLIIDGITSCSGVMVNNTSQDGTPYVLTASHCINKNFSVTQPEQFEVIAGSIVCFFNYNSPLCTPALRGTEELSMASARLKVIHEPVDLALLELLEMPPNYFQPYYAGWNLSQTPEAPYFGIHHPSASVKRVSWLDDGLEYGTFTIDLYPFDEQAHWKINEWTAGCTAGGSSGSPLFDGTGRVIGALSGGRSTCTLPMGDYYFAIDKAWEPLKPWLSPSSKSTSCNGLDPYAIAAPCIRLSHIQNSLKSDSITMDTIPGSNTIPLFGNNPYMIDTYVEKYTQAGDALLYGAYLVTPTVGRKYNQMEVEIVVYEGDGKPETLLYHAPFQPKYTDYSRADGAFTEQLKSLNRAQESFMAFPTPISVKRDFFVGYRILSAPESTYFAAYNLPEKWVAKNTTWMLAEGKWIEATHHPVVPRKTALFIDPVVQANTQVNNSPIAPENQPLISLSPDRRAAYILLPHDISRATFSLVSMQGEIIHQQSLNSRSSAISLPSFPAGVYLMRLNFNDTPYVQKIRL